MMTLQDWIWGKERTHADESSRFVNECFIVVWFWRLHRQQKGKFSMITTCTDDWVRYRVWSMMMKQKAEKQHIFPQHSLYHHVYDLLDSTASDLVAPIPTPHLPSTSRRIQFLWKYIFVGSTSSPSTLSFALSSVCRERGWVIEIFRWKGWTCRHAWRAEKFCGSSTIYQLIPIPSLPSRVFADFSVDETLCLHAEMISIFNPVFWGFSSGFSVSQNCSLQPSFLLSLISPPPSLLAP